MKTLMLASAAVLMLGLGSAFADTNASAQQNQQQVAMNAQPNGAQAGSYYGQSFNAPDNTGAYVGGWQPAPPNPTYGGGD